MGKLSIFVLVCCLASIALSQKPWESVPRGEDWWIQRHESFIRNSQENGGNIQIVFIGSSLVEYWGNEGREIWDSKYAPLGAVNYGIGGDKTENVIWRVNNGELDGISPKLIVVYIGSNNIPTGSTAEEIQRGVETVISVIREKIPNTRILYMSIFPRDDQADVDAAWTKITNVNEAIEMIGDNNMVNVLTIFWDLATAWGDIKNELYLADKLHFNLDGYKQWDASMNDTFYRLLNA